MATDLWSGEVSSYAILVCGLKMNVGESMVKILTTLCIQAIAFVHSHATAFTNTQQPVLVTGSPFPYKRQAYMPLIRLVVPWRKGKEEHFPRRKLKQTSNKAGIFAVEHLRKAKKRRRSHTACRQKQTPEMPR